MSMYRDLLAGAWGERRTVFPGDRDVEALRAELTVLRMSGLRPLARNPAVNIVDEMKYDLLLLELCRALDIEHDPSAFDPPLVERARLEAALRDAGVDLDAR
jgi:hypothetical protein